MVIVEVTIYLHANTFVAAVHRNHTEDRCMGVSSHNSGYLLVYVCIPDH